MTLELTKKFAKEYSNMPRKSQEKVDLALKLFLENKYNPILRNHALQGSYKGFSSISAGGDIRMHYYEKGDKITVVFVRVGSHSQLYR
jgi:addiction module RelE/StbE family toxin